MNEKRIHLPWEIFKHDEVMRSQSHCINPDSDVGLSLKKSANVIVLLETSSCKDGRSHKNRKDEMLKKMNDYRVY